MFTGNRGCLVDESGQLARHHRGSLWITCALDYRDWNHPLDQPGTWTPLFFLDDAVALAAGHRPCGLCRRDDYSSYQAAVAADGAVPTAAELNRRLQSERLTRGRGVERAGDRKTWQSPSDTLPTGTVVVVDGYPCLLSDDTVRGFGFGGWGERREIPRGDLTVLTPPTSVQAMANGFEPRLAD